MILNNIEVEVLASIELIDAYNKKFPEKCPNKNVIYCVHNKINGKNYIGQTSKLKRRFNNKPRGHFKAYEDSLVGKLSGRNILYRAWKKYGLKSFTIYVIELCSNRQELNIKEKYWIKTLHTCVKDPDCFGYNLTWGVDDVGYIISPESVEKAKKTMLERYGTLAPHTHTEEANKKRKETIFNRYGSKWFLSTRENLEKSWKTKIERYGDKCGVLHSKESKEKAEYRRRLTYFFDVSNKILLKNNNIITLDQYFETAYGVQKELRLVKKHILNAIELLDDLRKDSRWSETLEIIFGNSKQDLFNNLNTILEKRKKDNKDKMQSDSWSQLAKATQNLRSINNNVPNIDLDLTWEKYKEIVYKKYSQKYRGKRHLIHLIDALPIMKTLKGWTSNHERVFGSLTERDKEDL